MTAENSLDAQLSAKDFAEVFKMLKEGEETATGLEKRLDAIEKGLDDLLSRIDAKSDVAEVSDSIAKTQISEAEKQEK